MSRWVTKFIIFSLEFLGFIFLVKPWLERTARMLRMIAWVYRAVAWRNW